MAEVSLAQEVQALIIDATVLVLVMAMVKNLHPSHSMNILEIIV